MSIFKWFQKKQIENVTIEGPRKLTPQEQAFLFNSEPTPKITQEEIVAKAFQRSVSDDILLTPGTAQDSALSSRVGTFGINAVPVIQLDWFASQSFIGYQMCAILAQHWLIKKACMMPAKDAIRKGYEITVNDGTEVASDVLDALKKADKKYRLNHHMKNLVFKGRIFGIRIAYFKIKSDDKEYYTKPFNLDGITKGSYLGIVQIDPYWVTPQLDPESAADPASLYFYEPTFWRVNNLLIHRSHLIIMRTAELADILKPTYLYGGIPVTQEIYQRVYAAEQTANEAPLLAMTKRTTVLHVDLAQAIANQCAFENRLRRFAELRDNFGIKVSGLDEKVEQFDTSLSDLDAVIMSQYQIVAAAANVPAVKLLGTTPKGFNATGEFEEANYHEELESIQAMDLTPLLERHHEIVIRSDIAPQFGIAPFSTTVNWEPLDSMTAKESAEVNKLDAETGAILVTSGAIDPTDERQRIVNDPTSGYNGLPDEEVESDLVTPEPEENTEEPPEENG